MAKTLDTDDAPYIDTDAMLAAIRKYPGAKKDRKVAECIAHFSNEDGESEPSDELIATMTGLTLDEVHVSTRRLAAKGIFTVETVYD